MSRLCFVLVAVTTVVAAASAQINNVSIDGAFADWNDEYCLADLTGCGDGSQTDTTFSCAASNHDTVDPSDTVYLRLDFEEPTSGANTQDACFYFDTSSPGNGTIDKAFCFSLIAGAFDSFTLWDCDDTSATSCSTPVADVSANSIACQTTAIAAETFASCQTPEATDIATECSVPVVDIGLSAGDTVPAVTGSSVSGVGAPDNPVAGSEIFGEDNPVVIDTDSGVTVPVELESFEIS